MEKLIDIIEIFTDKYGKFGFFVLLISFFAIWGVNHYNTPSRNTVSLFGIIEYQKSPDAEAVKSRRDLNVRLLHIYFETKREEINQYVNERWAHEFSNEMFQKKFVTSSYAELIKEENNHLRTQFFIKIGSRIQKEVRRKSLSLSKPLNELEWRLIEDIKSERQDIDKIIAITIDDLDGAVSMLFQNPKKEFKFTEQISKLHKALNKKAKGFEPEKLTED